MLHLLCSFSIVALNNTICSWLVLITFHFLFKGHGLWLSGEPKMPIYEIPDSSGKRMDAVMGGFYRFWSTIILLQVMS